jgi:hypothetical protein
MYELEPELSFEEFVLSDTIQEELSPIIMKYINNKRPLIDALEWLLTIIFNDYKNGLNAYENVHKFSKNKLFAVDDPYFTVLDRVEGDEDIIAGYICRPCALKLNATVPKGHVATWHHGICDFCGEDTNLCHTSDWEWTDRRYLEEGREC